MKNDATVTLLNFVLAVLIILGVVFALWSMSRTSVLRQMQASLPQQMQKAQVAGARAQQLLNDVITYNATARSPELAQIIQSAQSPQPAAK